MAKEQDFAKLFRLEGLGQVLVTLDEDDDGRPCVVYRASDVADIQLQVAMSIPDSGDYDRDEALARQIFDGITEDNIADRVSLLQSVRRMIEEPAGAA